MKFIFYVFINLSVPSLLFAQLKPLTVGDSLPNFTISKIINSSQTTIQTSAYKDKLLIIDFWSTNCSSCIKALPRMESLQKRFDSKIKIMPLTYEKAKEIIPFWKNNKYTKGLSIPTIVEDKIFHAYFPHYGVPHEVWIYKGKIVAITESEYVDVPNIEKILRGEQVNWTVKYDFYNFDRSKPLFKTLNSNNSLEYAAIRGYLPGVNSMGFTGGRNIVRDTADRTIRAYLLNEPIYVSYLVNFMSLKGNEHLVKPTSSLDSNQVIWDVKDPSLYMHSYKDTAYPHEWVIKNSICFEAVYLDSGQNNQDVYRRINMDLDRLLGLYVRWEKREEKVWVLRKISSSGKSSYPSGIAGVGLSIAELGEMFNRLPDHVYVFDEINMMNSNYWMNKVKISRDASLNDINEKINSYGFEMIQENRKVDKLIFSEINTGKMLSKR